MRKSIAHRVAMAIGGAHNRHMVTSDSMLLTNDVAKFFGVSGEAVRQWTVRGRLPALRTVSGCRIFSGHDVLAFAQAREQAAAAIETAVRQDQTSETSRLGREQ